MSHYPRKLADLLETLSSLTDREMRAEMLLDFAGRFREVPPHVARRPFPEEHRVKHCESEAFVWSEPIPSGGLKFHFAVENPQGISAKAMAVILDETLSGQPLEQVAQVPPDIVNQIFGHQLGMGKGLGLMGMVAMVQSEARRQLRQRAQAGPAAGEL